MDFRTNENIKNTIYQKQALNEEDLSLKNDDRKKINLKVIIIH